MIHARMEPAVNLDRHSRGDDMLIQHCVALGRFDAARRPPAARLEDAIGGELARFLLFALAVPQGRRGSSSP